MLPPGVADLLPRHLLDTSCAPFRFPTAHQAPLSQQPPCLLLLLLLQAYPDSDCCAPRVTHHAHCVVAQGRQLEGLLVHQHRGEEGVGHSTQHASAVACRRACADGAAAAAAAAVVCGGGSCSRCALRVSSSAAAEWKGATCPQNPQSSGCRNPHVRRACARLAKHNSPVFSSQPQAPLCAIRASILSASETTAREAPLDSCATKPTCVGAAERQQQQRNEGCGQGGSRQHARRPGDA